MSVVSFLIQFFLLWVSRDIQQLTKDVNDCHVPCTQGDFFQERT